MEKRKGIIIALVILAIATLIYFFIQKDTKPPKKDQFSGNLHFVDRENMLYQLSNKVVIVPTKENKFIANLELSLDSIMEVKVFKQHDNNYLALQFHSMEYEVKQASKATQAQANKEMLEPFIITLSSGAKIEAFEFSNKLSPKQQKELKGLIETLQIAFKNAQSWRDSELNSNGVYESYYKLTKAKTTTQITKSNRLYETLHAQNSSIEIKKSDIVAVIDKHSWLKTLNYHQEEFFIVKDKPMMDTQVTTKLLRKPMIKSVKLAQYKSLEALRAYLRSSAKDANSTASTATKKKSLKNHFDCISDKSCNFLDIQRDLKAYLLAHPDDYQLILDLIKNNDYKEYHHRLIMMLRDLGTPEAQVAMLAIIQDGEYGQSNQTQASIHLGFLKEPTPETIELIRGLKDDSNLDEQQRGALYFALGNLASLSQELYEQVAPEIISKLENAKTPQETILALATLENTQNNDIIDHVSPYLESDNTAIRRGAVEALRLTDSPKATQKLYERLQTEEYDLVINAIAFSLHNKKDVAPQIIKEVAKKTTQKISNSNDSLMSKSIDFLVKKSAQNQDAKDALKKMMGKNLSIEAKKRIIRGL